MENETERVEPTLNPLIDNATLSNNPATVVADSGSGDAQQGGPVVTIQPAPIVPLEDIAPIVTTTYPRTETVLERVEDEVTKLVGRIDPAYLTHHPVHGNNGSKETYRFDNDKGAVVLIHNGQRSLTPVVFETPSVTEYQLDGETLDNLSDAEVQSHLADIKNGA